MTYIVREILLTFEIFTRKLRYMKRYYETQDHSEDFENEHSGPLK